jgi:hypothetical protein
VYINNTPIFIKEKIYFTPSIMEGGLLNPLKYETVYSTPLNFPKPFKTA